MSAMLTTGMLSAAIASASESCFSAPPIVMLRLLSISEGSAAEGGGDKKRLVAMAIRTKKPAAKIRRPPQHPAHCVTLDCVGDPAGRRRQLASHPGMAFIAIIARMPQ